MAHTHSDGCKCNKKRVKRKVVRSGKVKMTSPQMARPMNVPNPYVQHNSFPGNMAPYGSMYNPRVVVESNRAEASGGLPTRASTNMGTETSHIELRHAETQHSALARPRDAMAQTVEPLIVISAPERRGNYASGFLNILPKVVPTAQLLQQAGKVGGTHAVAGLRFEQHAGTKSTYTVPQLLQSFAEGQIMRPPGGRKPAVQNETD